jgi:3-methyladenine DNA glycosylase AlkD
VLGGLVPEFAALDLMSVTALLQSPWHEERLLAVLLLVRHYDRGTPTERAAIYRLYLRSLPFINNWDIVDSSALHIVGRHLDGKGGATLKRLAKGRLVWSRRVAMMATFHTIKQGDFTDAIAIATLLIKDGHDLIHKAAGWMLREVGQRDRAALEAFLDRHGATMPRTMVGYAIEKLPPTRRRHYLAR